MIYSLVIHLFNSRSSVIIIYATNRYLLAVMAKFYESCYLVTVFCVFFCFLMIMQYIPSFGKSASALSTDQGQRPRLLDQDQDQNFKIKTKTLCDAFTPKKSLLRDAKCSNEIIQWLLLTSTSYIISIKYHSSPSLHFHSIIFVQFFPIKFFSSHTHM